MIRKISLILSMISLILAVVFIANVLPDTVPLHYNARGEVDRWGSKWVYSVFSLIPVLLAAGYELYRKKGMSKNPQMEDKLVPLMSLFFIAVTWIMLTILRSGAGSPTMDSGIFAIILILLGIIMTVFSNYMGKIRQNKYFGIKVPWVYKSEIIWNKTHRLGGFTGVIGGLVMMLSGLAVLLLPEHASVLFVVGLLIGIGLIVLVPTVYSAWLYSKLKKENKL